MAMCSEFPCMKPVSGGFQGDAPVPNDFSQNVSAPAPEPMFWCDDHAEKYLALDLGSGSYLTEEEVRGR